MRQPEPTGWRYQDTASDWQRWAVNTQVRVIIPPEDIDGVFMIGEIAYREDDHIGKIAVLQVMHRNAFVGEEKKKSKRGAGVKGASK